MLLKNKHKINFDSGIYQDSQGKYYKFNEYISNVLQDKNLIKIFNPHKDLKEKLLSGDGITLQNLQKLEAMISLKCKRVKRLWLWRLKN